MQNIHIPSSEDTRRAAEARQALDALKLAEEDQEVSAEFGDERVKVSLPRAVFLNLLEILRHTQHGRAVTLIPIHAELTTQQAAEVLNVSRPFVIRLLEQGKINFHLVGKHRRIRAEDLFAYKQKMEIESRAAMDALTAQAQEHGLDY